MYSDKSEIKLLGLRLLHRKELKKIYIKTGYNVHAVPEVLFLQQIREFSEINHRIRDGEELHIQCHDVHNIDHGTIGV